MTIASRSTMTTAAAQITLITGAFNQLVPVKLRNTALPVYIGPASVSTLSYLLSSASTSTVYLRDGDGLFGLTSSSTSQLFMLRAGS